MDNNESARPDQALDGSGSGREEDAVQEAGTAASGRGRGLEDSGDDAPDRPDMRGRRGPGIAPDMNEDQGREGRGRHRHGGHGEHDGHGRHGEHAGHGEHGGNGRHGGRGHGRGGHHAAAQTFRRGRALAFLEELRVKRDVLRAQLNDPDMSIIKEVVSGELKAVDEIIQRFMHAFELHEMNL